MTVRVTLVSKVIRVQVPFSRGLGLDSMAPQLHNIIEVKPRGGWLEIDPEVPGELKGKGKYV
jgi:hypothetical protein